MKHGTASPEDGRAAYAAGRAAYRAKRAESDNPNTFASGLRPYWAAGWNFEYELNRSPYEAFAK